MYYGIFAGLVLIYIIIETPVNMYPVKFLSDFHDSRYFPFSHLIQICFYVAYFYFFTDFLEFEKHLPKFTKRIKLIVRLIFLFSLPVFIYSIVIYDYKVFFAFFAFVAAPLFIILAIISYIKALRIKGILKYFIIVGNVFYTICSLRALYLTLYKDENFAYPITFFFIGLIFENIAFSLGLSYKVKSWHDNMIFQLKENVKIRKNQYALLEREIKLKENEILEMTKQAEQERIKKVESDFKHEIRRMQLDLLKNQMNPHFIFNALTSIKVFLIDNDKKNAVFYLNKFSKLIRKMLDSYRVDSYSLDEELEILNLYLSIENIRFNSEIDIAFHVENEVDLKSITIPPLLVQPFVENAIWHGLMHKKTGSKQLIISIYTDRKTNIVYMKISDNGVGREFSFESKRNRTLQKSSYGLTLVQERLAIFNKQNNYNYNFEIIDLTDADGKASGTEVLIDFKKQ